MFNFEEIIPHGGIGMFSFDMALGTSCCHLCYWIRIM